MRTGILLATGSEEATRLASGSPRRSWIALAALLVAPVAAAQKPLPDAAQLARTMARDAGKVRLLIVASPTDTGNRRNVTAVMREVLALRQKALQLFVVWTPVLDGDTREIAQLEAKLYADKRVQHFWDAEGKFSRTLGEVLHLEHARDLYLVYDKKAKLGTPTWSTQQLDAIKLRGKIEELLK